MCCASDDTCRVLGALSAFGAWWVGGGGNSSAPPPPSVWLNRTGCVTAQPGGGLQLGGIAGVISHALDALAQRPQSGTVCAGANLCDAACADGSDAPVVVNATGNTPARALCHYFPALRSLCRRLATPANGTLPAGTSLPLAAAACAAVGARLCRAAERPACVAGGMGGMAGPASFSQAAGAVSKGHRDDDPDDSEPGGGASCGGPAVWVGESCDPVTAPATPAVDVGTDGSVTCRVTAPTGAAAVCCSVAGPAPVRHYRPGGDSPPTGGGDAANGGGVFGAAAAVRVCRAVGSARQAATPVAIVVRRPPCGDVRVTAVAVNAAGLESAPSPAASATVPCTPSSYTGAGAPRGGGSSGSNLWWLGVVLGCVGVAVVVALLAVALFWCCCRRSCCGVRPRAGRGDRNFETFDPQPPPMKKPAGWADTEYITPGAGGPQWGAGGPHWGAGASVPPTVCPSEVSAASVGKPPAEQ